MNEIWLDIKGYEGFYQISNFGRVKSLTRYTAHKIKGYLKLNKEKILKNSLGQNGYFRVNLYKDRKVKLINIHRLVAEHFIANPNNLPEVNHKDGIKSNNREDNLEWITLIDNVKHAFKIGLLNKKGENHHRAKLNNELVIKIRSFLQCGHKVSDIAKMLNLSYATVSHIKQNNRWTHV